MSLHDDLVVTIRGMILNWVYPPGFHLREQQLSNELKVSRGPVREALRHLEAENLVIKLPNMGYSVRKLSVKQLHDTYEVRLALELFIVDGLTARGVDKNRLNEIAKIWDPSIDFTAESADNIADRDLAFHQALAEEFGNKAILNHLKIINEGLHFFRILNFRRENAGTISCPQHLGIIAAIGNKDREAARKALIENINSALIVVKDSLKEAIAHSYLGVEQGNLPDQGPRYS